MARRARRTARAARRRTVDTAAAARVLSLSIWLKICTDATSVLNGRLPEISTVAPNSLMARAKARAVPAAMAGRRLGRTMRRKIVNLSAPNDAAASSISRSSSMSTGCTARTTKGRVTNNSAAITPVRA